MTVKFTPHKPGEDPAVLTFLIADVRGYTSFTQKRGDEAAARLARRFAEVAQEGVEAFGGSLIELRGDEALAVFTSARGAIRAAAELQDAFKDETTSDPELPLPVGIGLDAGEAVPVAGGYRGGALNLAARLCAQASAGEILASPEVVHLARKIEGVRYERHAALELKGLEEPVGVFAVVPDERGPMEPVPRTMHPMEAGPEIPAVLDLATPLVGREHELRWLRWSYRRARHGHGRVAFVTGPMGIGKTRIAAELAHIARADGSMVLYASAANRDDPDSCPRRGGHVRWAPPSHRRRPRTRVWTHARHRRRAVELTRRPCIDADRSIPRRREIHLTDHVPPSRRSGRQRASGTRSTRRRRRAGGCRALRRCSCGRASFRVDAGADRRCAAACP